jgi:aminopeptidase N
VIGLDKSRNYKKGAVKNLPHLSCSLGNKWVANFCRALIFWFFLIKQKEQALSNKLMLTIAAYIFVAILSPVKIYSGEKISNPKSAALNEFYSHEHQNWYEKITWQKSTQTGSNIDVLFYHINADIKIHSPYIRANVICRFKIQKTNVNQITLDLHRSLTVDSITGNAQDFKAIEDHLQIDLDKIYNTGDTAAVEIFYHGVPVLANETKGLRYEVHGNNEPVIANLSTPYLAHYWWPCKDGPGDKPDSVYLDITVPDTSINGIPVIAVSNGLLEKTETANDHITFFWRHSYPITPYYILVAISNYQHFQQNFETTPNQKFPIDYYVFDEHLNDAKLGVAQMPMVMELFSSKFGAYPFRNEKYAMTQLGYYGGIEKQTNTIINKMSRDWLEVSVHELAHMWFGDMITCKDWHHGWLNEGFATYAEALWAEQIGGLEAYREYMKYMEYWDGGTLYLQDISDPFQIFIGIIYRKGAYLLHMLRGVLGDEVFFKCLKTYATHPDYMYSEATTENFQSVCDKVSGIDLNWFFEQWIYDEYYPIYQYGYYQDPASLKTTVQIEQVQSSLNRRPVFIMPVQLKFIIFAGQDTTITVNNDSRRQIYEIELSSFINTLEFDPDNWILGDVVHSDSISNELQLAVPDYFILSQNYPNPFNQKTTIEFILSKSNRIKLIVYNVLGGQIATIFDGYKNAGKHIHDFDASNLASGIYYYILKSGESMQAKKMVLIK